MRKKAGENIIPWLTSQAIVADLEPILCDSQIRYHQFPKGQVRGSGFKVCSSGMHKPQVKRKHFLQLLTVNGKIWESRLATDAGCMWTLSVVQ